MNPFRYYTDKQIAAMAELAQTRGLPIDRMNVGTFLNYLERHAPDIIRDVEMGNVRGFSCHEYTGIATLLFNGETLYWQDQCNPTSWTAYSGKEEFWRSKDFSVEAQKAVGRGPLPAGTYIASQARYQELSNPLRMVQGILLAKTPFGGTWSGGTIAWGTQRVWLEPQSGTETYGRSNFSIHGGAYPGSAGCIDLVGGMANFAARFRQYGRDIRLTVEYGKQPTQSHHRCGDSQTIPSHGPYQSPSHHK